jgi:hypothetical protein
VTSAGTFFRPIVGALTWGILNGIKIALVSFAMHGRFDIEHESYGRRFRNGHAPPGGQQQLDGIGQVFFRDVMIAPFDAE